VILSSSAHVRRPPSPSLDRVRGSLLIPALAAAAGALLLVIQWSHGRVLWLDEEMIAINIRDRSLAQLIGRLSLGQAAPYGWLVLQRMMYVLFGPDERALRFIPMACGVATLATAAWIGSRWMRVAGAVTLVFLCALGQWVAFHGLELKHYSADVWLALLLPALAVHAIPDRRRVAVWWIVAAVAQWFANGALFVTPACAIVIVWSAFRREGMRGAAAAAWPGLIWLALFGVNYVVALGPARASEFLRSYWVNAFPPAASGIGGAARWLAGQLRPFAIKPGGSGFSLLFWIIAATGLVAAPGYPPAFRLIFALVPLSGFVWAAIRLVPMFERLSLWMVPALYVGIAMAADGTAALFRDAWVRRSALRASGAVAAAVAIGVLLADVYRHGTVYLDLAHQASNHETDDRGAIIWLQRQRQPGDTWVTTHNALPAVWWYAGSETAPVVEALFHSEPDACGDEEAAARLRADGARRALVYFGFGHDLPPEFDDVLMARLSANGTVTAYRRFGDDGHAAIVDLRQPAAGPVTLTSLKAAAPAPPKSAPEGCIAVTPARRW
jgi:hypothetical protein